MVKKVLVLILTVVLLGSFMVPASAAELSFSEMMFFSVDYRTESPNERITGAEPVLTVVGTIPTGETDPSGNPIYAIPENMVFEQDGALGVPVADFNGTYSVGYEVDHTKLEKDFTVEVYFKLGPDQNGAPWSMVCGTTWMGPENKYSHGFSLNTSSMAIAPQNGPFQGNGVIPAQGAFIGTKKQFLLTWSTGIGNEGVINDSFAGGNKTKKEAFYDQWLHVVYTHDGENEALYFNGEEIFNREAYMKEIVHDTSNEMSKLFRIAGYNWANNWDMVDMQCAYVNLYEVAATADEAATLYADRNVVPEGVVQGPTAEPTTEPTTEPTDDGGEAEPTDKPDVTPAPTKAPTTGNAQTFDLGIVSLAAVAISSAVVAKKRKK